MSGNVRIIRILRVTRVIRVVRVVKIVRFIRALRSTGAIRFETGWKGDWKTPNSRGNQQGLFKGNPLLLVDFLYDTPDQSYSYHQNVRV